MISKAEKSVLLATMILAFGFGSAHFLWPGAEIPFHRLHIFLFNLCSGGTLLLYHISRTTGHLNRVRAFFLLSLFYAISAAMGWFLFTVSISIPMVVLTESIRVERFEFFPWGFFRLNTPADDKFAHASLLCLSLALIIASLVIINSEYLGWLHYPKLNVDVFFLGYSFPISLITISLMFGFVNERVEAMEAFDFAKHLGVLSFWVVNLGVIIFFLFIIADWHFGEVIASLTLTMAVMAIFGVFIARAVKGQQKTFLLSGMSFLLLTAISGVLYILRHHLPFMEREESFLLVLHSTISLYGWNLSGLLIIIRFNDFPIRMNSLFFIGLHWIIVMVLAPTGEFSPVFSATSLLGWILLLGLVFFSAVHKPPQNSGG